MKRNFLKDTITTASGNETKFKDEGIQEGINNENENKENFGIKPYGHNGNDNAGRMRKRQRGRYGYR